MTTAASPTPEQSTEPYLCAPDFEIQTSGDEESIAIFCNGKHIATLNHDDDGWAGMARAKEMTRGLAAAFGKTARETSLISE